MNSTHSPGSQGLSEIEFDASMMDDFPAMVWGVRLDGSACYYNKAARVFSGDLREGTAGGAWLDEVHPEDRNYCFTAMRAAFDRREPFEIEFRMRRHDGEYRWLVDRGSPVRNRVGKITGYLGVAYDVTNQRTADLARRESEEQVRMLSAVTHDMIWNWDLRSRRVLCNATLISALGEFPSDTRNALEWWRERLHPDDMGRVWHAFLRAIEDGYASVAYEYRIRDRTGAYIAVDEHVSLIRDHSRKLVRILGATRDISKRRRAEEAQMRMTRILEATTDLVIMTSAEGAILFMNDAGRKMLGLTADQPLNLHLSQIHPEWANEIVLKEAVPSAIRDGYWKGETALLHQGGHEIPVSQVILSHPMGHGGVEFLSSIMRDLSDRKREEIARIEWANRYDAAIRASGQVLFDWNTTNNDITYAGDLERLLGHSLPEMGGNLKGIRALIHPSDLETFDQEVQRVIATRDPFHLRFRVLHKDGSYVFIEAKGYFFMDQRGQIGRMVGFFADVTAQERAEESLARARETLEQRVQEAREQAEAASRAKSEFLSRMSHELRTPLNAILGFTQLLELDSPNTGQAESIAHILRAGRHLLSLVDEVLDITRVESGRLSFSPEPIFLPDFLSEILDLIHPLADRHGVTASLDPGVAACAATVLADPQRLKQVFRNLLSNAVKYNRPGGRVVVNCRKEGTRVRLSVADTGTGIAPEKIHRLFLPFERLGAESSDVEGAGIGLALSRGIITALGGELGVESVPGEGSTFWVVLPGIPTIAPPAAPALASQPAASPPVASETASTLEVHKTLLYIEDQDLNLRLVERILQSRPEYRLLTAMEGGHGLELAREHQPDLVLLDLNLPDMTGEEVLRRLKSDPALKHITVLMVSADAMEERIERLLQLGASGYLIKPYKIAELLRMIDETLSQS